MGELMTIKNIGFIGLGAMGSVMAPLIVKSGCRVLGYDIKAKIDKSSGVKQVEDVNDFSGTILSIDLNPLKKKYDNPRKFNDFLMNLFRASRNILS